MMKRLFYAFLILEISSVSLAQDILVVKSDNQKIELQLSNEPSMTIGETITVTDGTTTKTFNANQRIVLTAVSSPTITTDLNGDGKFNMKDVQLAFDIYMELKDGELPDFNSDGKQNMKDVQYLFDKYMEE